MSGYRMNIAKWRTAQLSAERSVTWYPKTLNCFYMWDERKLTPEGLGTALSRRGAEISFLNRNEPKDQRVLSRSMQGNDLEHTQA